jgi:hypothetical protein
MTPKPSATISVVVSVVRRMHPRPRAAYGQHQLAAGTAGRRHPDRRVGES